jgi:hypothetical protein
MQTSLDKKLKSSRVREGGGKGGISFFFLASGGKKKTWKWWCSHLKSPCFPSGMEIR